MLPEKARELLDRYELRDRQKTFNLLLDDVLAEADLLFSGTVESMCHMIDLVARIRHDFTPKGD